jgi:hypothetical protein
MLAQEGHLSAVASFAPGDIKSAGMFGDNIAEALRRLAFGEPTEAAQ